MYGEKENISNMPELLTVQLHRSNETGRYYLQFIDHSETTCNNDGIWTYIPIEDSMAKQLLRMCYPEWDGETVPFRYSGALERGQEVNCLWCNAKDCEHSFRYLLMLRDTH